MNFQIVWMYSTRKSICRVTYGFYVGCTNVETGKPEYILLDTMDEIDYMRAVLLQCRWFRRSWK